MSKIEDFDRRNRELITRSADDNSLHKLSKQWFEAANSYEYSYHYSWLSRPIIQYPQDIVALQELIWMVKPDLIVETGIAHGGSLILSASMLAMLDYCEAASSGRLLNPADTRRKVVGIDIDIRKHNRVYIEEHPMSHHIEMIQGSSIESNIVDKVYAIAEQHKNILVILDSNHTHEHVYAELEAYAPLTSKGSYCVVFDTIIEDMPEDAFPDRPWGKNNNPKTAVREYISLLNKEGRTAFDGERLSLKVDKFLEHKLLITVAPDGYLIRI